MILNILNKSSAKIMNYLSEMKELDQIILQKGLFASIKKVPLFDKTALGQSRSTGGGWISTSRKLFMISFIYIKKNVFSRRGTINKASDPRRLYLYKIVPDYALAAKFGSKRLDFLLKPFNLKEHFCHPKRLLKHFGD